MTTAEATLVAGNDLGCAETWMLPQPLGSRLVGAMPATLTPTARLVSGLAFDQIGLLGEPP